MNNYIQKTKTYIATRRNEFIIIVTIFIAAILIASLAVYGYTTKYVYQPTKACDLFTPAEGKQLLGDKIISLDTKAPVVSGDTATSKCSYTDTNPKADQMIVAAVAIRSAINDTGIQQNKAEFTANKKTKNVETVTKLGESAFFNKDLGQLNILDGHNWIIISYGVGSAPSANSVDKAVELAHKVLQ